MIGEDLGAQPTDQTLPTLRITSPAHLVAGIPALLGFHPTESLVTVLLEDRGTGFDDPAPKPS